MTKPKYPVNYILDEWKFYKCLNPQQQEVPTKEFIETQLDFLKSRHEDKLVYCTALGSMFTFLTAFSYFYESPLTSTTGGLMLMFIIMANIHGFKLDKVICLKLVLANDNIKQMMLENSK